MIPVTICRSRPTSRERPSFSAGGRNRGTAPGFSCEVLPCHLSRRPRIPLPSDFSHLILLFAASPFMEKSKMLFTRKHRVSYCLVRSQHMFFHKGYLFKKYISSKRVQYIDLEIYNQYLYILIKYNFSQNHTKIIYTNL